MSHQPIAVHPSVLSTRVYRRRGLVRILTPVERPGHRGTLAALRRVAASSGCAAGEPPESGSPDRQGESPLGGFGAVELVHLAAGVGLSGGLTGDPQCSADVGPRSAFAAGGVDHEIGGGFERLSGVSQGLEVVQGALGASSGSVQGGDGPTDPPTGRRGLLGAHGAERKPMFRLFRWVADAWSEMHVAHSRNGANYCKHDESGELAIGAPTGARSLISCYISRRAPQTEALGKTTKQQATPATLARPGVVATTTGKRHGDTHSV